MSRDKRNKRKARTELAVRIAATIFLIIVLAAWFCVDAKSTEQTGAAEYLHEIGADNAQRAHVMALYEEWGA